MQNKQKNKQTNKPSLLSEISAPIQEGGAGEGISELRYYIQIPAKELHLIDEEIKAQRHEMTQLWFQSLSEPQYESRYLTQEA